MTAPDFSAYIGRRVRWTVRGRQPEEGEITSANDAYVFVRYDGDPASKATKADQLELLP